MSKQSKQPVHWRKGILLPIWTLRIVAMFLVIIAFGLAIKMVKDEDGATLKIGGIVVFFLFIIAVLLLDILQILMFVRDNLTPISFLVMNGIQTGFWAAVLLMNVIIISKEHESAAGMGLIVGLFLLFLALFVYAAIGYHRQRKQAKLGNYAPAHNPTTASPTYHYPAQHNTAYHSPNQPGVNFGQLHSPQPAHGAAADYYSAQPTKPAHMV